ncbi:MAG: Ig domain-containing protein, partial [Bacteroidales bacterium]|nr:Ig domain-containing protein [Bacteroidales bacterium]
MERGIDSQIASDTFQTTITATRELSTRSFLQASGSEESPSYSILWDAPDSILVGYSGTTPAAFKSQNEEPAAEATFVGKLPEGSGTLYGIYPVDSSNSVDADGVFSIAFKDVQTAVAGSYDPTAFPAVAQSDSKDLSFQNVCGLLELTVGYDDVTKISLSGAVVDEYDALTRAATMVPLPGGILTGEFGPDGLELTEYSEDLYEIVLNAPEGGFFSQEETYYMAVPPCNLSSGVTFTLTRESGDPVKVVIRGSVSVERSKVHQVKTLYVDPYIPVTSITLNPSPYTIKLDEYGDYMISAIVEPANASNPTLTADSSNETIVTVGFDYDDVTINVYPHAVGEATITVSCADGITAECKVTVEPILVEDILIVPPMDIVFGSGSQKMSYDIFPENATDPSISWESSNDNIVSVDQSGNITPVGVGECEIIAIAQDGSNVQGSCLVRVIPSEITDCKYTAELSFNNDEEIQRIEVSITPDDGSHTILFKSYDESVAIVDSDGYVTPKGDGTTYIEIRDEYYGYLGECVVSVQLPNWVTAVSIDKSVTVTWVNGKLYLTCYLEPYDGEYDHIEWSSSDESVAYMSNDGELTARGEG